MPLYDYKCKCGYEGEHIAYIDERLRCPECKKEMERQMPYTHGICMGVGAYGYYDENLQTYIKTNAHRREVMRQQGVVEKVGKGWY